MRRVMLTMAMAVFLAAPALAQETPAAASTKELADKIIDDMEARMRGKASQGEFEMYIKRWDRTLRMKFWELYPDKSLVKIVAPAEDAGKGSLKLGKDLWAYDPNIDQVQKIPPSLMLDSWMGSDFSNDDVSRSSSIKLDYEVGVPEAGKIGDVATWRVTLIPKPDSPVVWEKEVVEVAQDDYRPFRQEYYDEKGRLARVMVFEDFKPMTIDGVERLYPHLWRMESMQEKGRYTEMRVKAMEFKDKLPKSRFSIRALKKGR